MLCAYAKYNSLYWLNLLEPRPLWLRPFYRLAVLLDSATVVGAAWVEVGSSAPLPRRTGRRKVDPEHSRPHKTHVALRGP